MDWARILAYTTGTVDQDLLLRNDQTVGNVLRHHGIPPAPERKRRTTWAEFIQIHLALLAGTDISAAEVLMRGLVTCYVPLLYAT